MVPAIKAYLHRELTIIIVSYHALSQRNFTLKQITENNNATEKE